MKDLFSFLAGAVIGGAAALLLAPESGQDTRKKLQKEARKVQKQLDEQTKASMEKLEEARKTSVEKLNELRNSTEEALENAAKRMNAKTEQTRSARTGSGDDAFAATDLG